MKKIISLLFLSILLFNCKGQTNSSENQNDSASVYNLVSPQEFAEILKSNPEAQLIDVRTPEEYNSKHIGNAKNINYNDSHFDSEIAKLDKNQPIFVYCLSGGRSKAAASKMETMGFKKIYELDGGMMKWNASGIDGNEISKEGMSKVAFDQSITSSKKVLVDFYAEWCGPCKKMAPYIESIAKDGNVKVLRIDVDKNETLANELKVDALPTLVVYENGKKVWEHVGYITEEELRKQL